MKLSMAMIVKNEEKYIEDTLKPLKKLQNYIDSEIVIVDTGSTDNTVEIAKKYTDKVYFHEWNNNFSDMRNISITYCTGDWILIVDADEVLYDIEELAKLIKDKNFKECNGALIKIIDFDSSIENSIKNGSIHTILRLFKKGTVEYKGIVHEQPQFHYPVIDSNIRFIHYGYNNSDYELMEYKFKRNIYLLLEQLRENPNDVYVNYQIAVSYTGHKDFRVALKYIEIAYNKAMGQLDKYVYVIDRYCFILYIMGQYEELLEKVKEGIKYSKDFIDFYFYAGEAYYKLNDYDNAVKSYDKYLYYHSELKDNMKVSNNTLSIYTRGFKNNVLYNLALCYYKSNSYKKSLDTVLEIDDIGLLKDKALFILMIVLKGKFWNDINIVDKFIDKYNYENILFYIHKEILLEDLKTISEIKIEENLQQIVEIVKCFKENEKINEKYLEKIKSIIDKNKTPYLIYVYYVLKYDIEKIKWFMPYGKDKMENILLVLSSNYYDFNGVLLEGLNTIKFGTLTDVITRTGMERALLLSGNLPLDKKKHLFLNYVSEKYYAIIKSYNSEFIDNDSWLLSSEDRFIVEFKNTLQYKYEDRLKYIKSMKNILYLEKDYVKYIELLLDEVEDTINHEVKTFIPELVKNIDMLINSEKYQEAYDTIEEALSIVKFDFDLMVLKYSLLVQFNYKEEVSACLRDIILYGEEKRVKEFIEKVLN